MSIPASSGAWPADDLTVDWSTLDQTAKRERILGAAGRVFSTDGLDAPMPAIAAAAGAGVGSLYRQFPSKRDLLAALVARRLDQAAVAARQALGQGGDAWEALTEMLWTIVERQSGDDFLGEAMVAVSDHPEVIAAKARAAAAVEGLLGAARGQGRLRADASTLDVHLLFAATRAAKHVEPTAWRRMLTLLIDGLRARC